MENKIVTSDFLNACIIELFANCSMKIHLKKNMFELHILEFLLVCIAACFL